MKKTILTVLAVLLLAGFAFASGDNYQKIYAVDDPVYGYIRSLYLLEGYAVPSTTGPWSGAELKMMLGSVDYPSLSGASRKLYDLASDSIDKDARRAVVTGDILVSGEMYINTNSESSCFQGRDNWFRGWANERPFLNLVTEQHIGNQFYGYFDFSVGVAKNLSGDKEFGDSLLWTNIPFLLSNDMKQLDFNMPVRAFVSAGGDNWTLQVGRDRMSWGNGTTGNLILGNHIKYHNMARFSAYESRFKYTFLVSAFPHPQMYYTQNDDGSMSLALNGALYKRSDGTWINYGQSQYMTGISAFISHRLEWRILPSLSLALTEGVMYMSKDNKVDLIAFAPAFLYHNNYTRSNTNSILGLEADWSFAKGWEVYGQLVVDEFFLPGESNPRTATGDNPAEPNSVGFIGGVKYAMALGEGVLTANAEGAVTSPYLYLRDGDIQAGEVGREQTNGRYGLSYVVALREMSNTGGTQNYNLDFLGYRYGGDAIVGNLNIDYSVPGKWNTGANLFYMVHGTHDKYTVWTRMKGTGNTQNMTAPTTKHQTANYKDAAYASRDAASRTLVAGLSGACNLPYGFTVGGQLDFIHIAHVGNRTSNGSVSDVQMTLIASYCL